MTTRLRYVIEQAQPPDSSEPYKMIGEVFNREDAKKACPLDGNCVPILYKETRVRYMEAGFGVYWRWEPVASGVLWPDELHSDKPLDGFLEVLPSE